MSTPEELRQLASDARALGSELPGTLDRDTLHTIADQLEDLAGGDGQ